jgi:cell division protein FtsN
MSARERVLFSALELADNNGGIVLNISERGLAMRVVNGLGDTEVAQMRFQVAQSRDWLETRVRVAWIDTPRTTVGVEFIELSQEARDALKSWISALRDLDRDGTKSETAQQSRAPNQAATASTEVPGRTATISVQERAGGARIEAPRERSAPDGAKISQSERAPAVAEPRQTRSLAQPRLSIAESLGVLEARPDEFAASAETRARGRSDRKWTISILVFAILVFAGEGFYGLAHFRRSVRLSSHAARNTAKAAPVSQSPAPNKPSESAAISASAGFVVQAGAMAERKNAVELADALQQKGFPSFIYKGDSARLYEVVIGPYPSAEAAEKINKQLQTERVDGFVRSWPFR